MTSKIRLYFSEKIQSDLISHLTREQSHYLKDVMRLNVGDLFTVFNTQGEWQARVENYHNSTANIKILKKVRNKEKENNLWLAFSPIKQNPLVLVAGLIIHLNYKLYFLTFSSLRASS